MSIAQVSTTTNPLLNLEVHLPHGATLRPAAMRGARVLDLLRAYGIPVKVECDGEGRCCSCHVRIPADWRHLLPPPSEDELDRLAEIPGADESSRLACEIVMSDELDGLELEVQPESLVPQIWIAG